ncbi:MAG: flagellar biogenesis protein [Sphingomonas sanxanigenens]|uniref:Flagellar biogenesis protein n=1 Tax=Sphingomonas sanxanigenens TaxID=397260 RepID=A0A2W5CAC5_9SPHN|nr:MAG: flagellar biogenesis protein [Sphingomonas sanxanigenens]
MIWAYLLKLALLLPLVCGLLFLCLWAWRKLESRLPGTPSNRMMNVRETMMVSPGLRLAVIEFEGRKLLVSVGRGGVNLIDKVESNNG